MISARLSVLYHSGTERVDLLASFSPTLHLFRLQNLSLPAALSVRAEPGNFWLQALLVAPLHAFLRGASLHFKQDD